jgi:hypothetical protein
MRLAQLKVTIKGLVLALGVAGLVSCGSGDESGGGGACGGAENNGVCLFVESLVVSDVDEGPDVDVIQGICALGPPVIAEDFVIARTAVTFGASQIGPELPSTNLIIVTGWSISYRAIPPISGPPFVAPVIPAETFTGNIATILVNGTATANVDLFTFDQKSFYVTAALALNGGVLPPSIRYEAVYIFTGEDEFGESVDVAVPVFFDLANYNLC